MRPRPHGANFAYDLSRVRMDSPVWNPVQCFEPSRGNFCSLRGAFHLGHVNFPLQTPERVSVGAEQNSVEVDAIAGHRTASSCLLPLAPAGFASRRSLLLHLRFRLLAAGTIEHHVREPYQVKDGLNELHRLPADGAEGRSGRLG